MEYVTRTTNTVTMNTDCAYLKHNHRDPETIKKEMDSCHSRPDSYDGCGLSGYYV